MCSVCVCVLLRLEKVIAYEQKSLSSIIIILKLEGIQQWLIHSWIIITPSAPEYLYIVHTANDRGKS